MPEESKELVPVENKVIRMPRNKKELARLYDRKFMEHAPVLLEETFLSLIKEVKKGDPNAIKTAAEILKLTKGQGGVQVNVQQNNNHVTVNPTRDRTAEAIVRRLEARKALDRKAAETVDAEFTNLPDAS